MQRATRIRTVDAFILTGGLSSRMGRDKSRLRLGKRTMPGEIRHTLAGMGLKVRTIRKDAVARCGPLGGIYTALKRSRAEVVLLLACDMPFVSAAFLQRLLKMADKAVFSTEGRRVGFPLLLRREECLSIVAGQIERGDYSLQALAGALKARRARPPKARELSNINTPADLAAACKILRRRGLSKVHRSIKVTRC